MAVSSLAVQTFGDQLVVDHPAASSPSPYVAQIALVTSELAMAGMPSASAASSSAPAAPFWNADMSASIQQQHHHVDPYRQFLKSTQTPNPFCISDHQGWEPGNQANSNHESLLIRSSSLPQPRLIPSDRCNIPNSKLYRADSCSISTVGSDHSLHNYPTHLDSTIKGNKTNGVESSDEDQQTSMQQTKRNNGNNTVQHKGNVNSRKRPRTDQNSNIKAIETPPDVVHVRARRGQATDSHSLAERVRREKISQRMKVLQEIVPGCHKVLGKAMMLDEIINYVKSLQKQVEFLSMKLAAANQVGIDSMVVNKDYSFSNEFLQNISNYPSHGDVVFLNFQNELSSSCQQLRPEGQIPSSI